MAAEKVICFFAEVTAEIVSSLLPATPEVRYCLTVAVLAVPASPTVIDVIRKSTVEVF